MKQLLIRLSQLLVVLTLSTQMAWAVPILVRNGTTASGEGGYGSVGWSTITGMVDAASGNQVTVAGNFSNNAQVQAAGALWVNTGALNGSTNLSAGELANVVQFINSGKRVVLFGENTSWTSWNNNILSTVGGTQFGSVGGSVSTVLAHPLTAGVNQINVPAGASAAAGGTALFNQNVATLWGAGNVLTFLDSNTLQDTYIGNNDNTQFGQNLANWIAAGSTSVPEPSTLGLLGIGLLGLGVMRRKRG